MVFIEEYGLRELERRLYFALSFERANRAPCARRGYGDELCQLGGDNFIFDWMIGNGGRSHGRFLLGPVEGTRLAKPSKESLLISC